MCYCIDVSKVKTLEKVIDRVLPTLGLAETRVFNYTLQQTVSPHRGSTYITIDRFCSCTHLTTRSVMKAICDLIEKDLITKTKHPGIRTPQYLVPAEAAGLLKNEPYQEPELP